MSMVWCPKMSAEAHQPTLQNYSLKQRAWEILAKSPRVFSHRQFTASLEDLRRRFPEKKKDV